NSPSDRERWRAARGVGPGVAWWPANAMSDFDTLAGDFAEAFATWLTGSVSQSRVAPQPGPAELALLAELASNRSADQDEHKINQKEIGHSAQVDVETVNRYG